MKWLKDRMFRLQMKKFIELKNSDATTSTYNQTHHIALLFDENQIDNISNLDSYLKRWQAKGKKIEIFSYIDSKKFPEEEIPDNKICRANVNWYGMPTGDIVNDFIRKSFDILITINPSSRPCIRFINAASKAKFKIGLLPDELEFYDLMIDIENPNNLDKVLTDIQLTLDKLAN